MSAQPFDFLSNIQPVVPQTTVGMNLLCELSPGSFDGLIKIITLLQDYGSIIIENSKITQALSIGTAVLTCDISNIIGPNINLHILNPKNAVRLFKIVKVSSTVKIFDDTENARYVVSDSLSTLYLRKQINAITLDNTLPSLTNIKMIGNNKDGRTFTKEDIKRLSQLKDLSEDKSINVLIKDNDASAIYTPNIGSIKFVDKESIDITEVNAELSLKSYSFLMFDSESVIMHIAQNLDDDKYWLMTIANNGFVIFNVFENVENISQEQLLI